MPALSCPSCKKTFQVPDPAPGAAMPAYSCPQCKVPLTGVTIVNEPAAEIPTLTAARKRRPPREDESEPTEGGGWVVCLVLVLIVNGVGIAIFLSQDSAPKQAAVATLQAACTLCIFVAAYCIQRMSGQR